MRIEYTCPNCENKLFIENKDIKILSKTEKQQITQRNKKIEGWKNETKNTLFGKKRKYSDRVINECKVIAYGKIKCPICKQENLLINEKSEMF